MERMTAGQTQIVLEQGDITRQKADAIVNAANTGLRAGAGVCGAIHSAAGRDLARECDAIRSGRAPQPACPTGSAAITGAGAMEDVSYVIHAAGPIWRGGAEGEDELLRSAYLSSLQLAAANGVKTIAFPSISTGIYGFPIERAARLALSTVRDYALKQDQLSEIRFILFTNADFEVYKMAMEAVSAPSP